MKKFTGIYPASNSLYVPFHGCIELDGKLSQRGEHWLTLEHLIEDADFTKIEVLVDSYRTILGARATFKGSLEEWRGERGYKSRKRVLAVFMGGDGPELSKDLPLAFDGGDFGQMVYTFDYSGHASWRKPQGYMPITEAEYVEGREKHKRECDEDGCKNMTTAARVILPLNKESEQGGAGQPATAPEAKLESGDNPKPESESAPR